MHGVKMTTRGLIGLYTVHITFQSPDISCLLRARLDASFALAERHGHVGGERGADTAHQMPRVRTRSPRRRQRPEVVSWYFDTVVLQLVLVVAGARMPCV